MSWSLTSGMTDDIFTFTITDINRRVAPYFRIQGFLTGGGQIALDHTVGAFRNSFNKAQQNWSIAVPTRTGVVTLNLEGD